MLPIGRRISRTVQRCLELRVATALGSTRLEPSVTISKKSSGGVSAGGLHALIHRRMPMIAGRSWGVRAPFAGATGGCVGAGTGPCAAPVGEASEGMGDLRAEPLSRHLEKTALGW